MYGLEEFFETMLMFLFGVLLIWAIVTLTEYILKGIALSRMAKNAGFSSPALAWVPVANSWLLGSLCDRSQYAFIGKRWHFAVLLPVMDVLGLLGGGILSKLYGLFADYLYYDSSYDLFDHAAQSYGGSLLGVAGTVVLAFGLYRLYQDYAPGREVLFLILSVVFGRLVQAILLMTIRNNVPVSADPNVWGRWTQPGGYPPPASPGSPGTTGWSQPPYQSGPNPGGPGVSGWPPPASPGGPGTTGWSQPPRQSGPNPGSPEATGQASPAGSDSPEPPPAQPFRWEESKNEGPEDLRNGPEL